MATEKDFKSTSINKIFQRNRTNIKNLGDITLMHVMRNQNKEADSYANKAIERIVGTVKENNEVYVENIP